MQEEFKLYRTMINEKLFQKNINFYKKIIIGIILYVILISLSELQYHHPQYEWATIPFIIIEYLLILKIYSYIPRTTFAMVRYFKRKKPKNFYQKLIYQELDELKNIREEMLSHDDDPEITLFDDLIKNKE